LRDKGAKLEAINKQAKKLEAKQESSERDLEELGKGFRESKKRVCYLFGFLTKNFWKFC
jgi:hypothetical protein